MGGGGMEMLGGGEGSGTLEAHPTQVQSIFDYTQTGLASWEPVIGTQQYELGNQVYTANRLAGRDPFLVMWQLANGDIVLTNEPLTSFLATSEPWTVPATESWTNLGTNLTVASNQIMVDFDTTMSQTQIEQFIDANNLEVIFSSFEPPSGETGNDGAWFHFKYPTTSFASYALAHAHFSAQPHVESCLPNSIGAVRNAYAEGAPYDEKYVEGKVQQLSVYGINTGGFLSMGPPDGNPISRVATAVLDHGVNRNHEDFLIPQDATRKKISWVGMDCSPKGAYVGIMRGSPPGWNYTHGNLVAGTMTSTAEDVSGQGTAKGIAGLAPQNGVFPVKLNYTSLDGFDSASIYHAVITLKNVVKRGTFYEDIRVVNMSFYGPEAAFTGFPGGVVAMNKLIASDQTLRGNDRLYVASSGNYDSRIPGTPQDSVQYPAACQNVIGVTGVWTNSAGTERRKTITNFEEQNATQGAVFRSDDHLSTWQRAYNLTAFYGFGLDAGGSEEWDTVLKISFAPNQQQGNPLPYDNFRGTSFAAPQVAALASELYRQRPEKTFGDIRQRMYDTGQNLPAAWDMPRRIRYIQALDGWQ